MGDYNISVTAPPPDGKDTITVNKTTKRVHAYLSILRFKDKDTHQDVCYCASLDLSGYGDTEEKASEMLKFSINDYFQSFGLLSSKQIDAELAKIGWKQHKLWRKQYSKAYVDINGDLKNFNAIDDKVERVSMQAV